MHFPYTRHLAQVQHEPVQVAYIDRLDNEVDDGVAVGRGLRIDRPDVCAVVFAVKALGMRAGAPR